MDTATYTIIGDDYGRGGTASKQLKELLKRLGVDPQAIRRAMVAAYEAEMNVVIHAKRGTMRVAVEPTQMDVVVTDEGPGIPDIEKALEEGYSTAPAAARELGFGAGMGLPNIRRNTHRFSIQSEVGRGTQLRFTVLFAPEALVTAGTPSVQSVNGCCRQCLMCLHACPTRAIRVHDGHPEILPHLCIDCTSCVDVCETGALAVVGKKELPSAGPDTVLVLPVSFLEQFGPDVSPPSVLKTLDELGFKNIRLSDEWEDSLRDAVREYAAQEKSLQPVIAPMCPAVVDLVRLRFPSLIPHVAPFLTPIEAAREELSCPHIVFVPTCPSQHALLRTPSLLCRIESVLPETLRNAVGARVVLSPREPVQAISLQEPGNVLRVTGMRHVVNVLEELENERLDGYSSVELYACDEGCFGSPVWKEEPFLARGRYARAKQRYLGSSGKAVGYALRRIAPLQPRAGLRLDPDMHHAIKKLEEIDRLASLLPGRNCAVCGAPTCAALAEDIVLGRAKLSACVYRRAEDGSGEEEKT